MATSTLTIPFSDTDASELHTLYADAKANRVATVTILAAYVTKGMKATDVADMYVAEVGDYSCASVLQWLQGYAFATKAGVADNAESVTLAIKSIVRTSAAQRNAVQPNMTPATFGEFVAKAMRDFKTSKDANVDNTTTARPGTSEGKNRNPEKDAPTVTPESAIEPRPTLPEILAMLNAELDNIRDHGQSPTAYENAVKLAAKTVNRHKVAASSLAPVKVA